MKTLKVFEVLTGEWCAATWSGDTVYGETVEEAIEKWRASHEGSKVKVEVQK